MKAQKQYCQACFEHPATKEISCNVNFPTGKGEVTMTAEVCGICARRWNGN